VTPLPPRTALVLAALAALLLAAPSRLPPPLWPFAAALAMVVVVITTWALRHTAGWGLGVLSLAVIVAALRAPVDGALPHLGGYALGLGLACGVMSVGPRLALRGYAVAGLGAVVVGLLFLRVDTFKFLPLALTDSLPQLGRYLPWMGGEGRVNPNALSALCLMVAPLAWAAQGDQTRWGRLAARLALGLSIAALVLAQSRAAWMAALVVAAVAAVLRAWRMPAYRVPMAAVAALLVVAGAAWAWWDPAEVDRIVASGWSTFDRREHTWRAAWQMVRADLWLGVGLDQFRVLYVPAPTALPGFDIAHAHNFPLQLLLDVGSSGFAGYIGVLSRIGRVAWRGATGPGDLAGRIGVSTLLALGALHVYGLFDAVALGTKVGLFQWWIMSLALVAGRDLAGSGVHRD
jgi:putative inorganic carbon (HCO3(-)) transporter